MSKHSNTVKGQTQTDRIQTTLTLDADLWRRVKIQAINEGRDGRDLVEDALRDYLKSSSSKKGAA